MSESRSLICRARKRISGPKVIGVLVKRRDRLVDRIKVERVRINIFQRIGGGGGLFVG